MFIILGGYIGILFLSMVMFYILPKHEVVGLGSTPSPPPHLMDDPYDENAFYDQEEQLYEKIYEGAIDEVEQELIAKKESISYEFDELVIIDESIDQSWAIIVEEIDGNSGEIEIIQIETPYNVNGVDISDLIDDEEFIITGNELMIPERTPIDLSFMQFTPPFYLNQFKGVDLWSNTMSTRTGSTLLYLKVPHDIEISGNNDFIHYID